MKRHVISVLTSLQRCHYKSRLARPEAENSRESVDFTAEASYPLQTEVKSVLYPLSTFRVRCYSSGNGDQQKAVPGDPYTFLKSFYASQRHGILSIESGCKQFCELYRSLSEDEKLALLCHLAENYGANQEDIVHVAQRVVAYQARGEALMLKVEERLRAALTARYQLLFSDVGRIEGGVKFLVDMRADILKLLSSVTDGLHRAHLQTLQHALRDLLSLWFTVGFLNLERITWHSSCDMLQKISDYEAVHPVRNWADLKRRVGSYRRCFVFTHSSMPGEPIVVLHTALTDGISSTIHSITGSKSYLSGAANEASTVTEGPEDPDNISTAIFYSITSTQKGLQGVDLGNYLIKRVVGELQREWPQMTQFSSMSPIPGFRDWLIGEINRSCAALREGKSAENIVNILHQSELDAICQYCGGDSDSLSVLEQFREYISSHSWVSSTGTSQLLKPILMRLCARYLYLEKRRGYALNSVANFHLQNGAVMWRLNWCADMTLRGLNNSCSMMVNYRYYLKDTVSNSQQYIEHNAIRASEQIKQLCSS